MRLLKKILGRKNAVQPPDTENGEIDSQPDLNNAQPQMVGLFLGIDFLPSPSDFQTLLRSGELPEGLKYHTSECPSHLAGNKQFLITCLQGAADMEGVQTVVEPVVKRTKVNGKPVVIVYPAIY